MTATNNPVSVDAATGTASGVGALLRPRSVAVIGASADPAKIGGIIIRLLSRHGFPGRVFPVNPKYETIGDLPCFPDVAAIPADETIDLAIVYVRAADVPDVAEACAKRGVRGLVVITSGFAEIGDAGADAQRELIAVAERHGMAVSGPNCAGIANFTERFVAYGTTSFIDLAEFLVGGVAILTASGGFGNAIFTYCQERRVGVSHLVGLGNEAVTQSGEFLADLVDDDSVKVVLANLESIRRPAQFFAAARKATLAGKHVVVLKGGRSQAGQQAIVTHTAALGGAPEAYAGAFRQHGVIQVTDLDELVDMAMLLTRMPPVRGPRLGVLSLPGGGTGLVADIAADHGFEVPQFTEVATDELTDLLPALAVVRNPLDPTAGFGRDGAKLAQALRAIAADPNIDVVVFFPLAAQVDYALSLAEAVCTAAADIDKPVVVIWTATNALADGAWRRLHDGGVPLFTTTRSAFLALQHAREHELALQRLISEQSGIDRSAPPPTVTGLTPAAVADQLAALGVGFPPTRVVHSGEDAGTAVSEFGRSAMKVVSPGLLHKTDVGGVRLGIADGEAARTAYDAILADVATHKPGVVIDGVELQQMAPDGLELLVGVHRDDQLGLVLTVGLGGVLAELLRDVAVRPLPVSRADVEDMLSELRGARLFESFRGSSGYDRDGAVSAILAVSAFAVAAGADLAALELNPLILPEGGGTPIAVDLVVQVGSDRALGTGAEVGG